MKRKKVSVAALSLLMLFSFPVLSWAKPQNTEGKWYNHAGKWYFGKDEKELLQGWIVSDGDWYISIRKAVPYSPDGWIGRAKSIF